MSFAVAGHRWGLLESVTPIRDSSGKVCSVLFRCDCGKYVRVSIVAIRNRQVPEGCPVCVPVPNKETAKYKTSQLIKRHPKTYESWRAARKSMCVSWKRSFYQFYLGLGPKPKGKFVLSRHRPYLPHGPGNSYWGMGANGVYPIYYEGKRVTYSWLAREHDVSVHVIKYHARKGVTDAKEIINIWRQKHAHDSRYS